MARTIDKKDFKNEVIECITLAIVQFKCEWSGACQIIAPVFEDLAKHYKGAAKFFVSDIAIDTSLEKEFGIQEVPTILFFKSGEIIDYSIGLISKNALIEKIENALTN